MCDVKHHAYSCQIERIENHNLWQLYMMHRHTMLRNNNTSAAQIERLLWHGTSVDSLDNIYAGGLNRSYCGKNGTIYRVVEK